MAGAPFEVAMAFDSITNGDYVAGGLGIVGGVLNALPAAELVGARGEAAAVGDGLRAAGKLPNSGKASNLKRSTFEYREADLTDLGAYGLTLPDGKVLVQSGLSDDLLTVTLRHESIHPRVKMSLGKLGTWGYQNIGTWRYLEGAVAEGYGTGNVLRGLSFPLSHGYVSGWRLAGEGGVTGGSGCGDYYYSHRCN